MNVRAGFLVFLFQAADWVAVLALFEVITTCPPDHEPHRKAKVTILSDESRWQAYAFCEPTSEMLGDFQFNYMSDMVTAHLDVYFAAEKGHKRCIFMEDRRRLDVFQINIEIYTPFGERFRSVSCVYQDNLPKNGTDNDKYFHETDPLWLRDEDNFPARQIHQPKGGPAQSNLDIYLMDIKNQPVGSRKWHFGRYLKLAVELVKPVGKEISFHVDNCLAKELGQNQTYKILSSGRRLEFDRKLVGDLTECQIFRFRTRDITGMCGDGVILPLNKGFVTLGKIARSPPFKAFHLLASTRVYFWCSFYTCHTNCDGSSCEAEILSRKPRDVSDDAVHNESGNESTSLKLNTVLGQKVISPTKVVKGGNQDVQDEQEEADSEADVYVGIGFVLGLVSIVATISLIACRWLDIRGLVAVDDQNELF